MAYILPFSSLSSFYNFFHAKNVIFKWWDWRVDVGLRIVLRYLFLSTAAQFPVLLCVHDWLDWKERCSGTRTMRALLYGVPTGV